jgi:hypothetical protein
MFATKGPEIVLLTLVILAGCAPKLIQMDQAARDSLITIKEVKVVYDDPPDIQAPLNPVPNLGGMALPPLLSPKTSGYAGGNIPGFRGALTRVERG